MIPTETMIAQQPTDSFVNRSDLVSGGPEMEGHTYGPRIKVGDKVNWNFAGNQVTGQVVKVHTSDVEFKGQTRHCSKDDPQYEVESDASGETALHKGSALGKAS